MMNEIDLINKRIFLIKIQAVIYLLLIITTIFGTFYLGDDMMLKFQFFKIYFLFFALILFCKAFYFENYQIFNRYLFIVFLNITSTYEMYSIDDSISPSFIFFIICILCFCLSLYFIYIFLNKLQEQHLFKTFIYINATSFCMFVLYGLRLLDEVKFPHNFVMGLMPLLIIFSIFTFFVFLLSIPLNLISEYRYFKKELKQKN